MSSKLIIKRNCKMWLDDDDLFHREDGPAIIYSDGSKKWYIRGILHREDGPAISYSTGIKEWWLNGLPHRGDGPAITYPDGMQQYWLNGKYLKFFEYKQWFIKKISSPSYQLTDGDVKFIKEHLR